MLRAADESITETRSVDEEGRFQRLLHEMRAGSPEAASAVVETYGPHIRSVVKRKLTDTLRPLFDSEDFVQSAWTVFLRMEPEKIDAVREPRQLVNLMAAIAARKMIDRYRRQLQYPCDETRRYSLEHPEVVAALAELAGINTPSQLCIAREKQEIYRQRWEDLVSSQPPRDQRILNLRLEGRAFSAIAQTEEVSERHARRVFEKLFRRLSDADRAA